MSEYRPEYWTAQVEAVFERLGLSISTIQRDAAEEIVVNPDAPTGREERADLIFALQHRGITVTSQTSNDSIHVDASAESLEHPIDREVDV